MDTSDSASTVEEQVEINSFMKALRMPPDRTGLLAFYDKVRLWWIVDVWDEYTPSCIRYPFERFWYEQISSRLFPRNRWATKVIPRTWTDKVSLIPEFLYAAVINFVSEDGEDCFNATDFPGSGLAAEEIMLREIYEWAKTGRAALQERIMAAHPKYAPQEKGEDFGAYWQRVHVNDPRSYEEKYSEVNRLQAELDEKDTRYLCWICSSRSILWT